MSNHRISPNAGWVHDEKSLSRGPNGRPLCRQCSQEVPKGRRTFCGAECVHRWKLKTDPGYLRSEVWKRDGGRCASCRLDTGALELGLGLLRDLAADAGLRGRLVEAWEPLRTIRRALRIESRHSLWDADHVVAVADGGGECDLGNMQTLCLWCHRAKSSGRAARGVARCE